MTSGAAARRGVRAFKPYPEYEDCGVEWLGEIPAHWEVKRLKHVASINSETLPEDTPADFEMVYVDIGGVDGLGRIIERESLTFGSAPSRARRVVKDGDVVVSTVRTYLRAIAPIVDADSNLVVSTGFAVVRPSEDLITDYAAYALRAPYFVERVVANSKGVSYPAINETEMATYGIAVPPQEEQRAIAAFLNRETAKIDALVTKKERLIELLQEKRTALITHAVTKGLDPSVPMKDSGVEWLGQIPAHWDVSRLKYVVEEPLKYGANEAAELTDADLPRYIRITDIEDDGTLREETFRSIPEEIAAGYLLSEGDLLLARSGATVGKTFLYQRSWGQAAYAGYLIRARFDFRQIGAQFVQYFTQSTAYWDWVRSHTIQATIQNVSAERYASLIVPVPPVDEQRMIIQELNSQLRRLQHLVSRVQNGIERLNELRTALISAAVTGKIDVREEVG